VTKVRKVLPAELLFDDAGKLVGEREETLVQFYSDRGMRTVNLSALTLR
jgi:hypothetical protein